MKKMWVLLAGAMLSLVVVAEQTSEISIRQVRDPVQLRALLSANAADAESRIAVVESSLGTNTALGVTVGALTTTGAVTIAEGALADSTVVSADIKDGTIVNADLNAAAAIAHTKLAPVLPGYVFVGNASSQAVAVAVSGDVTIDNAGAVAIASGVIVNADVATNAAIVGTKLASAVQTSLGLADTALQPNAVAVTNTIIDAAFTNVIIVVGGQITSWTQTAVGE
jgi:hypothetical protein